MAELLRTERLLLRDWSVDDTDAALSIYGDDEVARWLAPAMRRVPDAAAMRSLLEQWVAEQPRLAPMLGRWAVQRIDGAVVGALVLRTMPPYDEDVEIAWQVAPAHQRHGYATEAAHALVRWAFGQGLDEVFAVVRPANVRGVAMAKRLGMEWVGESDKFYGLELQVYRLRPADLAG